MAQVRKLNQGKSVPQLKAKGTINYNGTSSEFSDKIYESLINKLDTSAASGIIRKGLDLGRQEGNTFTYDSETNRAIVTDSSGKKIWDYQGSIGPRSNFKVQLQGTFNRNNLNKNPNDVNRLLQSIMSDVDLSSLNSDKSVLNKKSISRSEIKISPETDKTISIFDSDYVSAANRLKLLNQYYTDPEKFTNEYEFKDDDLWKNYLDQTKDSINSTFGQDFSSLLDRISSGTYDKNDEEFLNSLGIYIDLKDESLDTTLNTTKLPTNTLNKDKESLQNNTPIQNTNSNSQIEVNNNNNNNNNNNDDNKLSDYNYSFNNYYLPQYYDATVLKASGLPEHLWKSAKSWTDESGHNWLELTNNNDDNYYVYHDPDKNAYLRSQTNPDNIFLDQETFWDLIEKNSMTPLSPESWNELKWMPRTELVRTTENGPIDVIGWESINVGNYNIPIRKDISKATPNYYAKLADGNWVTLSELDYINLKNGDLSVLNKKKQITFYKDGGILKAQEGVVLPVYNLNGNYYVPVKQTNSSNISGSDKVAIVGTGVGSGSAILSAISTNPKVKRVFNIGSLLGFGAGTIGNTVSNIRNNNFNLGNLAWSIYGLGRGIIPRPKQYYFHTKNTPLKNMNRSTRMSKGLSLGLGGAGRILDGSTRLLGTTMGTIGTTNFIKSIVNDPNKTMNWNTWTTDDSHNFQMGMTGLTPFLGEIADLKHNSQLRKRIPKTSTKFGSLDEIKFATKPSTNFNLKSSAVTYIKDNPIKEAFLGNPYIKSINTASWNNPATKPLWFASNPSSLGFTGGLIPWEINPYIYVKPIVDNPIIEQPKDTIKMNGALIFKKGGILKAQEGGGLTFNNAFSNARKLGNETFEWNGKKYTTRYAEEDDNTWKNNLLKIKNAAPTTPTTPTKQDVGSLKLAKPQFQTGSTNLLNNSSFTLTKPTLNRNSLDIMYDFTKSNPFRPTGIMGDLYDLKMKKTFYPEQFNNKSTILDGNVEENNSAQNTLENNTLENTSENTLSKQGTSENSNEDLKEELKIDRSGRWAKSASLTGSLTIPGLEFGKFMQAMSTASKNGIDERAAIDQATKVKYRSSKPLIQTSYDFSELNSGLNNSLGQLNSQFKSVSSSTSDNPQKLAAFGMYGKNLSNLNNTYNNLVSKYKTSFDQQNLGLKQNWIESEYDRVNANNLDASNAILGKFQSRDAERQAKSGHINTLLNSLQNWSYKDKVAGSNIEGLMSYRNQLQTMGLMTGTDVTKPLEKVNLQIDDAVKKTQILPTLQWK